MQHLKLTLVQSSLFWGEKERNLEMFTGKLRDLHDTDVIILPEMFNTGFMTDPLPYGEPMESSTLQWMRETAGEKDSAVCGSFIAVEEGRFYNRLVWMRPDGTYDHYDKRHLFRMAGEHEKFDLGERRLVTSWRGWRICPMVCYDLRFPVWSRNRYVEGRYEYDLLIYIANWPEIRSGAWKTLLPARSVENLCVVAGVNRVGPDGNGIAHSGDSAITGPEGSYIHRCPSHAEETATLALHHGELADFRNRFRAGEDWDRFAIL